MLPTVIGKAVQRYMPNFYRCFVKDISISESTAMTELETILGVWLKKPTGKPYTPNESLIYTKTLITLIGDRGSVLDKFIVDIRSTAQRLLGDKDSDRDSTGVIDWDAREIYTEPVGSIGNAMAGTYIGPHDRSPDDPLPGMTYLNTSTELIYVYDGENWIEIKK